MLPLSLSSFVSTLIVGPLFDKIGRNILLLITCNFYKKFRFFIRNFANFIIINWGINSFGNFYLCDVFLHFTCRIISKSNCIWNFSNFFTNCDPIYHVYNRYVWRYWRSLEWDSMVWKYFNDNSWCSWIFFVSCIIK